MQRKIELVIQMDMVKRVWFRCALLLPGHMHNRAEVM